MRFAAAAAAAVLLLAGFAATPAAATQGLSCRPAAGSGPVVGIVIGSLGIAGVNLTEGRATRTTMGDAAPLAMRQAWIDEQRLWVDLTDANFMADEGRLRLQASGRGGARRFAGTFVRSGRLTRLRCAED
jgi:hypothetical protein